MNKLVEFYFDMIAVFFFCQHWIQEWGQAWIFTWWQTDTDAAIVTFGLSCWSCFSGFMMNAIFALRWRPEDCQQKSLLRCLLKVHASLWQYPQNRHFRKLKRFLHGCAAEQSYFFFFLLCLCFRPLHLFTRECSSLCISPQQHTEANGQSFRCTSECIWGYHQSFHIFLNI